MYENESNEELLNMLINANEVGASQETCDKLYNEVLRRMNASQQSVQADVCECVPKSLEPYREPLFCDRCGKSKRR